MRHPVVLVTGVDGDATESVVLRLGQDLPGAVTVRHRIDRERQRLTRLVGDTDGELERDRMATGHVCADCAIGADLLPVIDRLTRTAGRFRTFVVGLPVGVGAPRFADALSLMPGLSRRLRLSSVVTALGGATAVDALLGAGPLPEQAPAVRLDEECGIAEAASAMVEHADVVTVDRDAGPATVDLVAALARPDALVSRGPEQLPAGLLTSGRHDADRTAGWASTHRFVREVAELRPPTSPWVWRLDLSSPRPFHPRRLGAQLQRLAAGRHRARGCFWVPTRPGRAHVWEGAGGRVALGVSGMWGRRTPQTRLVITGIGDPPADLPAAFHELLAGPFELALRNWRVAEDGLEQWLGPVEEAA